MNRNGKREDKSDKLGEIFALIFSIVGVVIGIYIFLTKMIGSRTLTVVEGAPAQIMGLILIIGSLFNAVSILRKIRANARKK